MYRPGWAATLASTTVPNPLGGVTLHAIRSVFVEGFGRFGSPMETGDVGPLNLLVGENDTGKTWVLKLLYAVTRSVEEYWRKREGPEPASLEDLFTRKLKWTFLPGEAEFRIGGLVTLGQREARIRVEWYGGHLEAQWGAGAIRHLGGCDVDGLEALRGGSASFMGPKEILTIAEAIRATRVRLELPAFDDTAYDLLLDYEQDVPRGRLQDVTYEALEYLSDAVGGGEVVRDSDGRIWWMPAAGGRSARKLPIAQAAEGIRKVGVLFRLLRNRRINPNAGGFLFVDEPEANLHPRAEVLFAELLHTLARSGIQVFVATHSYFVAKRLEQLARSDDGASTHRLIELRRGSERREVTLEARPLRLGLPAGNPIVDESLRLLDRDVALDLEE